MASPTAHHLRPLLLLLPVTVKVLWPEALTQAPATVIPHPCHFDSPLANSGQVKAKVTAMAMAMAMGMEIASRLGISAARSSAAPAIVYPALAAVATARLAVAADSVDSAAAVDSVAPACSGFSAVADLAVVSLVSCEIARASAGVPDR